MNLLEARQICLHAEKTTLEDISFEIEEKGIYGFLGKSGAGKTLLASALAGACEIDSGAILYKDVDIYSSDGACAAIKRKIGYVPSKVVYDKDMTAFEVLDLVGRTKKIEPDKRFRQIKEALELTGLSRRREVLCDELTLPEKKRLAIAAALLGNPETIIMDEPLRTLDAKQATEIKNLIGMLKGRKLVIVFSARPADIEETCDNIAILAHGKLVLWESADVLLHKLKENGLGGLADALDAFSEKEGE